MRNTKFLLTMMTALLGSCGGGGGSAGNSSEVAELLAPVISFSVSSLEITVNETVTLSWSSSNTSSCTASGDWSGSRAVSGSEDVTLATSGDFTYTLSCSGQGGSSTLSVSVSATAPPFEAPEWDGIAIFEEDPSSDMWIEGEYRRLNDSERAEVSMSSAVSNFVRENYGLYYHVNRGYVGAVAEGPEASPSEDEWFFHNSDQLVSGDFNGDGLQDVAVPHWLGKPQTPWKPLTPLLLLINQGNGRLEVDPCIFQDCIVPTTREMYVPKVADFNADGVDDFITLPLHGLGRPIVLMSQDGHLVDRSMAFVDSLSSFQLQDWLINSHAFAEGDLNSDGLPDLFIPDDIANVSQTCSSTPRGCHGYTMLNNGDGTFVLGSADFPFLGNIWGSGVHDFDGDGYGDILVSLDNIDESNVFFDAKHWDSESAMIMFGNADGDYKRDIVYLPESPLGENFIGLEFHIDDLDEDGHVDLIAIHTGDIQSQSEFEGYYEGMALQVLKNNGGREFEDITDVFVDRSLEADLPIDAPKPSYYQYIDLDGDGDKDLWPKSGQYDRVFFLRETNKFVLSGAGATVLDYRGAEENCEFGCANTFYTALAIDIDQDGDIDFLQTEANTGWVLSQLMTLESRF